MRVSSLSANALDLQDQIRDNQEVIEQLREQVYDLAQALSQRIALGDQLVDLLEIEMADVRNKGVVPDQRGMSALVEQILTEAVSA